MLSSDSESELRETLLRNVKKEVKKIMEEAVTRKFVHEDSGSVTLFCGAIESCLLHGLKKRSLGLFKDSTTTALLQKIAKTFDPAAAILRKLKDAEKDTESRRMSSGSQGCVTGSPSSGRYMWIRLALFSKQLAVVVEHLMRNSSKYYEKEALMADPVDSLIFASLLVGPCSLDYSKMKIPDHYWTDPTADELVQRHRIHSNNKQNSRQTRGGAGSPQRPALRIQRHTSSSSSDEGSRSVSVSGAGTPPIAKDYVMSLHQNARSTLLYGKNNVSVQPTNDMDMLAGYLSLHQDGELLLVKWTPNQLMNSSGQEVEEQPPIHNRSLYWDHALTVSLDEIVYIHCHRQADGGGVLVMVGQDGVQRPPIHFPRGGHLLAFLSCLETGLLPRGHLDPPLWTENGKGKVFPKLRRKSSRRRSHSSSLPSQSSESSTSDAVVTDEDEQTDYVFHIVSPMSQSYCLPEEPELLAAKVNGTIGEMERNGTIHSDMQLTSSVSKSVKATDAVQTSREDGYVVQQLCESMKYEIISRAFYGWLSYCSHLKTVRTNLSGFVNHELVLPSETSSSLTADVWQKLGSGSVEESALEVFRLIYYGGGCQHEIRKQVWPYLLGYYKFGDTAEQRTEQDITMRRQYEATVSEWLAVEAIVSQCDREALEANVARLSAEQQSTTMAAAVASSSPAHAILLDTLDEGIHSDGVASSDEPEEAATSGAEPSSRPAASVARKLIERKHRALTAASSIGSHVTVTSSESRGTVSSADDGLGASLSDCKFDMDSEMLSATETTMSAEERRRHVFLITNPTVDGEASEPLPFTDDADLSPSGDYLVLEASPAVSNASSGGVYSPEFLESVAINIHRIDKDVQRCDRNYWYFMVPENLEKLRNVMCTYVWENIEVGYVQGMCDLVAPLLVIFDDEAKTFGCFCELMKRMTANFPHGGTTMDDHFTNMRLLIQILDPELFEHMNQNGDFSHFYFCYRWFLLDFKRELVYNDVFTVWETIWSAQHVSSTHLVLFIALALVEYYREIIIDNHMDFTDIIRFFNEMAERHDVKQILELSRDLISQVQDMVHNK